jgi:hypothetical protein
MSKTSDGDGETMAAEYDFTQGVRGKYAERFTEGTNVIVLDPDVAAFFGDAKAVNGALRLLAESAKRASADPVD